ncbi:MAG: hypothetical protein U0793_04155 [Gemmataceae bacterium]
MSKKQNIREARVENPKVVRLFSDPLNPSIIQVKGENPGVTKVFLTDETKSTEAFDVRVTVPGEKSPDEKRKDFLDAAGRTFPTASLGVQPAPATSSSSTATPAAKPIQGIITLAQRILGPAAIVDLDRVGLQQVQLEVIVAIVNRSETRSMSFSFFNNRKDTVFASILQAPLNLASTLATAPGAAANSLAGSPNLIFGVLNKQNGFTAYLQALRTEGLAKILSEPRVVTLSGEKAYINSGGEVPTFATSSLGQAEILYKAFGTTVEFVPKVLGDGRIFLEVHPEISDIDESLRVTLGQNTAPGFRTRRAHVSVMMEDGQTLAIGGLIQNKVNATTTKVPIAGDLPYVGAFFRNTSYNEQEEELVILVTPRLVHPISCTCIPRFLPGRETRSPDDYELFLEGILEAPRGQRNVCVGNGGWAAAHSNGPTAGLYPCNDTSFSHLGNHFGVGRCGGSGPCSSGLCGSGSGGCASGACGSGGCSGGACSPGIPVGPRIGMTTPASTPALAGAPAADSVVVESYAVDKGHVVPVGGPTPTGVTPGSFAPGDVTPAGGVSDASRLPSAPPVILEDPR